MTGLAIFSASIQVWGEVIVDGSLGGGERSLTGPAFEIKHTDGASAGRNLFHSLKRLNLTSSESATFTGPNNFDNILTRVTGGASSIDGLLKSNIQDANLFLMNPAGILFGSNASIDVRGSFFATTADYIRLGNDGRFAATVNPADSILSVSEPSAFGFLTPNPAAIRVQGSKLATPAGKTLGFVGGDVEITGDAVLQAEDLQIVSVRSAGEANLQLPSAANGLRWAAIDATGFSQRGAIRMDGTPSDPNNPLPGPNVIAQRVVIRGGTFVVKNANVAAFTHGPGDGVKVDLTGSLDVTDFGAIDSINFGDMHQSAGLEIKAGEARVGSGARIASFTGPDGAGGDLRLAIDGTLRIAEQGAIVSDSASMIRGGNIDLSANRIEVDQAGQIYAQNDLFSDQSGKAGNISLRAAGLVSLTNEGRIAMGLSRASGESINIDAAEIAISGANTGIFFEDSSEEGIGGSIHLTARGRLSIQDAGHVQALTLGRDGARISVQAGEVYISGAGAPDQSVTGITAETGTTTGGKGGDIHLLVDSWLRVLEGGTVSTDTFGNGTGGSIEIFAQDAIVTGRGGAVSGFTDRPRGITARNRSNSPAVMNGPSGTIRLTLGGRLEVSNAGEIVVDTIGSGTGGDIAIQAQETSVASNGLIAARTLGELNGGKGGNVVMNVSGQLEIGAAGAVTTSTLGSGAAGNVEIRGGSVLVNGSGARIAAVSGAPGLVSTGGSGAGGNLRLDVNELTITNDGQITASTYGAGSGGGVRIATKSLSIQDSGGVDFAGIAAQTLSTGLGGAGGAVRIDAQTVDLRGRGALVTTQSLGAGNSGQIQIATGTILLRDGGGIQSSSTGTGRAGSVELNAGRTVTLRDGGFLSVQATRSDAGNIRVRAGSQITLDGGQITAQAAQNGGSIDLRARDLISLTNSEITAAAGVNGGNIFIDPVFVLLDRSLISANAIVGRGGNIRIISDYFFASDDSLVTATSKLGIDGTVKIDALNNDLNDSLIELPSQLIDAESLLRDLCTMKIDNFSSFVSEGRGGLPPLPGEARPSLMIVQ